MQYYTRYESPFGGITLVSDGDSITGVWLDGQRFYTKSLSPQAVKQPELKVLAEGTDWLNRYFAGEKPRPSELSLAPAGSEFRQLVWKLLCDIPYGEVTTYGAIAKEVAKIQGIQKMAAQAVGGAVGHNPISIIIPCHRVVGMNGNLTGYGGGIPLKKKLLAWEGLDMSQFYI